jgi:LPPG:FO 2-phospho-L-lactate transferase
MRWRGSAARPGSASATAISRDFCQRLGISAQLLPMTDARVRTRLRTAGGWLDFQDYFVRLRCEPMVSEVIFEGADRAAPSSALMAALREPRLRAVVICPSNPFISVEPILSVPGVRAALVACRAPVIAVSPIIRGRAVKGPTAKMMSELGIAPSAAAVSRRYADLLDAAIVDHSDADDGSDHGVPVFGASTLMSRIEDKVALAKRVLEVADIVSKRQLVAAPEGAG